MKNQYFGDVSDYRKYGLLRCFAEVGPRVGVVWMLTPDNTSPDGRRTRYLLEPDKWRRFDPDLFMLLADSVTGAGRDVHRLESSGLLREARYFRSPLTDSTDSTTQRDDYFRRALSTLSGCDVAFFDPDNGLEVKSVPRGSTGSSRYLYWSELMATWARGHSVLIFQHFTRERRTAFAGRLLGQLQAHLPAATASTLTTSHVLFLLALQPHHVHAGNRAIELTLRRWPGQIMRP